MRKIYLFLVLACCGLVACEASLNPNDKLDPMVDPAIVEMEALIAEQNGEFDDNELLAKLHSTAMVHSGKIFRYIDNTWRLSFKDGGYPTIGYIFYENGTGSIYHGGPCCANHEGSGYYSTYQYEYDAKSNTLTTIEDNKFEAKVLYFKDDTIILEGYVIGEYADDYHRLIMEFSDERREELLNSDIPTLEEWIKMEQEHNN